VVDFTRNSWNPARENPLQEIQPDACLHAYSEFVIGQNRSSVFTFRWVLIETPLYTYLRFKCAIVDFFFKYVLGMR
jgi:hypothetical protein